MEARYWQLYQNSDTRAGSGGYEWHLNSVGLYELGDGTGANLATVSNTTSSTLRSGGIAEMLGVGSYAIFDSYLAGQVITVDAGEGNVLNVLSASYRNAVGAQWAPSSVILRHSDNGTDWTNLKVYPDNASTDRQLITDWEAPQIPHNYLVNRGRDRMRFRGISIEGLPDHLIPIIPPSMMVPALPSKGQGLIEVAWSNPMFASSVMSYMDYEFPLRGSDDRLWAAGSAYSHIPFDRRVGVGGRGLFLLLNKRNLSIYF